MISKSSPRPRKARKNRVLRVALTGGIACGKSVVAQIFREKGCFVQSADQLAREVMSPGRLAWRKIVSRFGEEILGPDRTIHRGRLGRIVFSDPDARRFLNALVHPLVMAERKRTVLRLEREGRVPIFVSEAALTIEAGFAPFYDKIVVVHCAPEVQVSRLVGRDGISPEAARLRIGSQMPSGEKLKHANYAIDTSGSLAETVEQAERVYASLFQDCELMRLSRRMPSRPRKKPSRKKQGLPPSTARGNPPSSTLIKNMRRGCSRRRACEGPGGHGSSPEG
jgi:dephospho-CoA kinase